MSQYTVLFIFLDLIAIVSLLNGIFTSSLILFIIFRKLIRHHAITNLLLANTCICTLEPCISYLIIYGYIITYDISSTSSVPSLYDQEKLCPIRSYLLFSGFGLLYTSYCLQAYYRLQQVVFYKKHYSFQIFLRFCIFQWILSFLLVLPMLLTKSFVYLPTEFFCPIPFYKPLSVVYIAVAVYGVFLTIFGGIYYRIYAYASRTTALSIKRRRTIDRQFIMLKRIVLPTFSLMFLGIVYLTMFFQAIANQYQTHFLSYRLSYLFVAIGTSFIHVITIFQTPPLRRAVSELFYHLKQRVWPRSESLITTSETSNTTTQQEQRQKERLRTPGLSENKLEPIESEPLATPAD